MKKLVSLFFGIALASCSSNKYAAHFQHYDRHENYASSTISQHSSMAKTIDPEMLTASLETKPIISEISGVPQATTISNLSKQERRQIRSEIKKVVKKLQNEKSPNAKVVNVSGGMDQDLKLGAIFGAVGIVALIIGGNIFGIIGAIALIIGVVFFIKWLIRQ